MTTDDRMIQTFTEVIRSDAETSRELRRTEALINLALAWLERGQREVTDGINEALPVKQSAGLTLQRCALDLLMTLRPQGSSAERAEG